MEKLWYKVFVVLLFALAAFIRLTDFDDLPLDFHPTRQLFSSLKARGICYQNRADVPSWQREIAVRQWQEQATIEPPIIEYLTAYICRYTALETWLVGRVLSILFWLAGGFGILCSALQMSGGMGALLALSIYLFLPYGVFASRSFMPDPLMVSLISLFFAALLNWQNHPSLKNAVLAGLLGGFAILVKLVAVFIVGCTFLAVVLVCFGWRNFRREKTFWLLALLIALPGTLYVLFGIYLGGYLSSQFGGRFFPSLLIDPFFYVRWELKLSLVLGQLGILFGLLGWLLTPRPQMVFLTGAWLRYILFGLVFNYHYSTHDYYHLPAIPIAALSMAVMGEIVFRSLKERWSAPIWMAHGLFLVALLFGIGAATWEVRSALRKVDYRPQASIYAEIGDLLGHNARALALTPDYGYRLAYWGWLDASIWPTVGDINYLAKMGYKQDYDQLIHSLIQGQDFFVITDFEEWKRQPFLMQYLSQFPLLAETDAYRIYDLRTHE